MDDLITTLFEFACQAHQTFADTVWSKNPKAIRFQFQGKTILPSYHNEHHIVGVTRAAKTVLLAFHKQHVDPLEVHSSLQTWNAKHQTNFTTLQFEEILLLALAGHDLGNLTKKDQLENGNILFADSFQLEVGPSEKRSANLTLQLIEQFDSEHIVTPQIKVLIEHLILQTIFHPAQSSSDVPFWLLMQVIDQNGNAFVSDVPLHQANAGYLNELYVMSNIGERKPMSFKQFLLFQPERLKAFFPDEQRRETFLKVIDPSEEKRSIQDYFGELPDRPIEYEKDIELLYKGKFNKLTHDTGSLPSQG